MAMHVPIIMYGLSLFYKNYIVYELKANNIYVPIVMYGHGSQGVTISELINLLGMINT